MSTPSTFIVGRDNRRDASLLADAAVLVVVAALMWALIHMGLRIVAPFDPHAVEQTLDTSPARLPYYAARSLLRMFVALAASLVFAFIYATAAARSRRLSKVLMPLLDVLQSVPILGFLSVTVTFWIALFPHSQLGVECASIFAIFTSQAWNLAFSLHSSLLGQSQELDESARLLRLTRWQRFWNVDLPSGMIPLTWNAMMSFGGGWFFLTASETIVVDNHTYVLPGIGSYVAAASQAQRMPRLFLAIAVMIAMVLVVNFFFWRPITAWAERFRVGDTSNAQTPAAWCSMCCAIPTSPTPGRRCGVPSASSSIASPASSASGECASSTTARADVPATSPSSPWSASSACWVPGRWWAMCSPAPAWANSARPSCSAWPPWPAWSPCSSWAP